MRDTTFLIEHKIRAGFVVVAAGQKKFLPCRRKVKAKEKCCSFAVAVKENGKANRIKLSALRH